MEHNEQMSYDEVLAAIFAVVGERVRVLINAHGIAGDEDEAAPWATVAVLSGRLMSGVAGDLAMSAEQHPKIPDETAAELPKGESVIFFVGAEDERPGPIGSLTTCFFLAERDFLEGRRQDEDTIAFRSGCASIGIVHIRDDD